jgi:threonyl-tRNA synthetase
MVAKVKFLNRVGTLDAGLVNTGPENEDGEIDEIWQLYDLLRPLEGSCDM